MPIVCDVYKVISESSNKALTVDEVKDYLNIPLTDTSDDSLIAMFIDTAICLFEQYTRRDLTVKTYELLSCCWKKIFEIKRSPLISVDSVQYFDEDQILQTVDSSNYYEIFNPFYSFLAFDKDFTFPDLTDRQHAIKITFQSGYANPVDNCIKSGLLAYIAFLYENRGDCVCDDSVIALQTRKAFDKFKIWGI